MTTNIIIQVVIAIIFAGGLAGVIKLPGKQKAIGVFVMIMAIISTLLLWLV